MRFILNLLESPTAHSQKRVFMIQRAVFALRVCAFSPKRPTFCKICWDRPKCKCLGKRTLEKKMLVTKKLQPKKPWVRLCRLNAYDLPQSAPNYSHQMPEWSRTYYPACRFLTKIASKTCTADTICSSTYHKKEKMQPDGKPETSPLTQNLFSSQNKKKRKRKTT